MEKKTTDLELFTEPSESGLKELVLRWFTETQASLLIHEGHFPDWFHGFATRKDVEEQLRDKAVGSFLIRLSEKTIGYILSYKGHDRCRHFVITQNAEGLFVIAGDEHMFDSLWELIEHYKVSPIQPFGEFLSSGSSEVEMNEEVYDVVNYNDKYKSGVSVQALRSLWDQKGPVGSEVAARPRGLQHKEHDTEQVPALPSKSLNRKLTGSVSVDNMALSQKVPDKAIDLGFSLSASIPDTSHPTDGPPTPDRALGQDHSDNPIRTSSPHLTYATLDQTENRSKSLPCLDHNLNEEERPQPTTISASYSTVAPKRVTCHTYSFHDPRDSKAQFSEEQLRPNSLYQLAEAHKGDTAYAEIPASPQTVDDTYEKIPEQASGNHSNTYETLEELKSMKSKSTRGKKHKEWKNFFTDYKKK